MLKPSSHKKTKLNQTIKEFIKMKNINKLITILSLSAVVLIGCGNNDAAQSTELPEEETEQTTEIIEENNEKQEEELRIEPDNIVVHSNHVIPMDYFPNPTLYEQEEFNHVQTLEQLRNNLDMVEKIGENIINIVSNDLSKNPYTTSTNRSTNRLIQELTYNDQPKLTVMGNNSNRDNTNILIIDKELDEYMQQNHQQGSIQYIVETLNAYESNMESAERTVEFNTTIFENEKYLVKLAPSLYILGSNINDTQEVIQNLNDYAEYFKTDEVQAVFDTHLNK